VNPSFPLALRFLRRAIAGAAMALLIGLPAPGATKLLILYASGHPG
jgi:hypothetical protein